MSNLARLSLLSLIGLSLGCAEEDVAEVHKENGPTPLEKCQKLLEDGEILYFDRDKDAAGGDVMTNCENDDYVFTNDDCNDQDATFNPLADEECDGVDRDCNGVIDDIGDGHPDYETFFVDFDEDTYGDPSTAAQGCPTSGSVLRGGDCNDGEDGIHPGAQDCEVDGIDDDCTGTADDGQVQYTYYKDIDSDGYGGEDPHYDCNGETGGTPYEGTSATNDDCNDLENLIHPGADERCNLLDDDCDGTVDEGMTKVSPADDLQDVLDSATDGAVVCLDDGTFTFHGSAEGNFDIVGQGIDKTVIDPGRWVPCSSSTTSTVRSAASPSRTPSSRAPLTRSSGPTAMSTSSMYASPTASLTSPTQEPPSTWGRAKAR